MKYTDNDQAVMLLCAHLPGMKEPKPLTITEWDSVALMLQSMNAQPGSLLDHDFVHRLPDCLGARNVTKARVLALLSRGHALGLAIADWEQRGITVLTRASKLYPSNLRRVLRRRSPPLFYVAGKIELLQAEAVGIVGSRDASEEAIAWAKKFGEEAAQRGVVVVSGAAKGIDEAGMMGSLLAGGMAVGYIADNLIKASLSLRFRNYIGSGRLALLTSSAPDARFSVGLAMGRNRFIYASAKGVCVVACAETGGTIEGAREAIKQKWGEVFVRDIESPGTNIIRTLGSSVVTNDPSIAISEILSAKQNNNGKADVKLRTQISKKLNWHNQDLFDNDI